MNPSHVHPIPLLCVLSTTCIFWLSEQNATGTDPGSVQICRLDPSGKEKATPVLVHNSIHLGQIQRVLHDIETATLQVTFFLYPCYLALHLLAPSIACTCMLWATFSPFSLL